MKIAIVGAGISGLSLYLWLHKLGVTDAHQVLLFERRQDSHHDDGVDEPSYSFSRIGGSLGLAANGLRVLRKLDESLYNEVVETGSRVSGWRITNARGWTLADVATGDPGDESIMLGRNDFCQGLRNRVPDSVIVNKKVAKVAFGDHANTLKFDDGGETSADMVVGADGIWSAVRRAMFDGDADNEPYQYPPHYEGLVGVGSFVPGELMRDVPQGQMK